MLRSRHNQRVSEEGQKLVVGAVSPGFDSERLSVRERFLL